MDLSDMPGARKMHAMDGIEARHRALLNRVAVLERALEEIAKPQERGSYQFEVTKLKMLARQALDG